MIINGSSTKFDLTCTTDGDWITKPKTPLLAGETATFEVQKPVNLDFSIICKDAEGTQINCSGDMHHGAQANKFQVAVTPTGKYGAVVDPAKTRENPAAVSWTIS
ncbi:hypothetical protein DB30_02786 [Enhygromyxa salina]|uniref:Uncharacterized protein n=1 Tax=Enhygromyxa salina TaxID=215803 RepID=A0A0C2A310_9BACT|nr:hypothetical protein DB30_02786 [Enhygromyxa salina]